MCVCVCMYVCVCLCECVCGWGILVRIAVEVVYKKKGGEGLIEMGVTLVLLAHNVVVLLEEKREIMTIEYLGGGGEVKVVSSSILNIQRSLISLI